MFETLDEAIEYKICWLEFEKIDLRREYYDKIDEIDEEICRLKRMYLHGKETSIKC